MFLDILIKNARIVDGTGSPWFRGDIGIRGDKITHVEKLPEAVQAKKTIDATDRYVMPGFVDIHTHSDFILLREPDALGKLHQGVTTQAIGLCGYSAAPLKEEHLDLLESYVGFLMAGVKTDWPWHSFGEWMEYLAEFDLGTNVVSFVGHGTIRIAVMGFDKRAPTAVELADMTNMVQQSMEEGAIGMSSGLIYPPGIYATPEEITAIASGLKPGYGLYASHMRSESDRVVESVRETIAVGEKNGTPVQIAHHKACGRKNWGVVHKTMEEVDAARKRGIDVTVDQYPYESASTTLRAILPGWVQEGGVDALVKRLSDQGCRDDLIQEIETVDDWDNYYLNSGGADGIILLNFPHTAEYEGKTLGEVARIVNRHPLNVAFDLIAANRGTDTCAFLMMSGEDVKHIMSHPAVMIISDSIPTPVGVKSHPRLSSTFPRVLDLYVRQNKTLRLEEAVHKMTAFPARRVGLKNRGVIAPHMYADLVLVNMEKIRDNATFADPAAAPDGIDLVIVNGTISMEGGKASGETNGKVLAIH